MTSQSSCCLIAARHASQILDSVYRGEISRLDAALAVASAECARKSEVDDAEAEFLELLETVVEELKQVVATSKRLQEQQMSQMEVPLKLLLHIVESGQHPVLET
jgi:hypothetical protein